MTTGQLYCALYALTILLWLACRQTFKATRGAWRQSRAGRYDLDGRQRRHAHRYDH